MRTWLVPIGSIALLFACGDRQEAVTDNVPARAPPAPEPETVANAPQPEAPPRSLAPVDPPGDYPGVAEMSPAQRRAYERGWRDCRAGRYAPDTWAEAYRIGCAAAQEAG